MAAKRKLSDCFDEAGCIGPEYKCPHCVRSVRRKVPRRVHFGENVESDANGCLIYEIGEIIFERFEIVSALGKGGYGLVLQALDIHLDKTFALKVVKNTAACHRDAMKEYQMLKTIQRLDPKNEHHFVQLKDAFCMRGHICLVFEFLGPDLSKFTSQNRSSTLSLYELCGIGRQLCDAIAFLHEHNIVHNDIKPENIVLADTSLYSKDFESRENLENREIRLIDFGSVKSVRDDRTVATTSPYRAPENLLGLQQTFAYDIWSIGCTLFEFYTCVTLFETDHESMHLAMMEHIFGGLPRHMTTHSQLFKNGKLMVDKRTKFFRQIGQNLKKLDEYKRFKTPKENEFFELLQSMLTLDPAQRISAKDALNHRFFVEPEIPSEFLSHGDDNDRDVGGDEGNGGDDANGDDGNGDD